MKGIVFILLIFLFCTVHSQNITAAATVKGDSLHATGNAAVAGVLTVTGDAHAAMLRQTDTWHIFGGFEDSAVVVSISQGVYNHVSNATGDLWTGIEADGFAMSGDTMTITNAGDYFGAFSVGFTTINSNVVKFRVFNVTDGVPQGFSVGATGDGPSDYVIITKPLYFDDISAGDKLVMQCTNIDASNDIKVRFGTFFLTYLHD